MFDEERRDTAANVRYLEGTCYVYVSVNICEVICHIVSAVYIILGVSCNTVMWRFTEVFEVRPLTLGDAP
jgi:hypothetical protein